MSEYEDLVPDEGNPESPHLGEEPVTPIEELSDENPELEEPSKPSDESIVLPDDILAIWGHSPEDRLTASRLIDAWGLDAFRGSQIHLAALQEAKSAKQRVATQKAFLDAQKRLKK